MTTFRCTDVLHANVRHSCSSTFDIAVIQRSTFQHSNVPHYDMPNCDIVTFHTATLRHFKLRHCDMSNYDTSNYDTSNYDTSNCDTATCQNSGIAATAAEENSSNCTFHGGGLESWIAAVLHSDMTKYEMPTCGMPTLRHSNLRMCGRTTFYIAVVLHYDMTKYGMPTCGMLTLRHYKHQYTGISTFDITKCGITTLRTCDISNT